MTGPKISVDVRTGTSRLEVVRITTSLGLDVVSRCRRRVSLGTVWITPARAAIEIVVAPGTALTWPQLRGTTCATADIPKSCGRRRWIVPPAKDRPMETDAAELAEVITDALVRRALTHLSRRTVVSP